MAAAGLAALPFATHVDLALWASSIVLFLRAFGPPECAPHAPRRPWWPLALSAGLPVAVRLAVFQPWRYREDMFATAWFSWTYDFLRLGFFGLVPEDPSAWIAEFPTPFFAVQRAILELLGPSVLAVVLSVQPWVAVTGLLLYLVVRDALDRTSALVAVVLYSVLAPAVYLESLGFSFVSSSAAFLLFFRCLQLYLREAGRLDAARTGVAAGACYLFYLSSWLAIPVLALFTLGAAAWRRDGGLVRRLPIALAGAILVLGPFVTHGLASGRLGGPLRRFQQVSALTGSWTPEREAEDGGRPALRVLGENLAWAAREITGEEIAGHGEYDFGRRPPFDRVTLAVLAAGSILALAVFSFRGDVLRIAAFVPIAFVSLVGLTTQPPAYHRFSIAFPFLAVLLALPFTALFRLRTRPAWTRALIGSGLLLLLVISNAAHVLHAAARDTEGDELRFSELLSARFPGRRLQVAAFPSFAFRRVYAFSAHPTIERIETEYHDELLERFRPADDLVVLIHAPHEKPPGKEEFQRLFADLDPQARLWPLSPKYSLLARTGRSDPAHPDPRPSVPDPAPRAVEGALSFPTDMPPVRRTSSQARGEQAAVP